MPKHPGLARNKSGMLAVRLRVPKDVAELITTEPARFLALKVNPGAPMAEWACLARVHREGRTRTVIPHREFKRSLGVRTYGEAEPPYFALMAQLEAVYEALRPATLHTSSHASPRWTCARGAVRRNSAELRHSRPPLKESLDETRRPYSF